MNTLPDIVRRGVVAAELLLIAPSVVFMGALIARQIPPLESEPGYTAQAIVGWYADRPWTLWILLIAFPFAVLVIGCASLMRSWMRDRQKLRAERRRNREAERVATTSVATATVTAGIVLAVVAAHMLAN